MSNTRQIELFTSADGRVELTVSLGQNMVWLTQGQMMELFKCDQSVFCRHINNVFKEGELSRQGNMQKMHIAHSDKISFKAQD